MDGWMELILILGGKVRFGLVDRLLSVVLDYE